MLPTNPMTISLAKLDKIIEASPFIQFPSQLFSQLPNLVQKSFFPKGIKLEEYSLAASGNNGGKEQAVLRSHHSRRQAKPVASCHAVTFVYPDSTAYISRGIVAAVFKTGRRTAVENAIMKPSQGCVKIPAESALILCY